MRLLKNWTAAFTVQGNLSVMKYLVLLAGFLMSISVYANKYIALDAGQERLLLSRYIHRSAHWNPVKVLDAKVMVNKSADRNQRAVHPHRPQKGYPQ
jgi:hypothetical protein